MTYDNTPISDSALADGSVSSHVHFRRIRDNTTRFDFFEDAVISAPPQLMRRWIVAETRNLSEVVGKKRRGGFLGFGGYKDVYGNVTRWRWAASHIALYHGIYQPDLPEGVNLIGVEVVGAALNIDDESDWVLADYDVCVINNRIHFFATAAITADELVDGNGRKGGHNQTPSIPENYPGGVNEVPEPPSDPPNYTVEIKPLGVRGGGLDLEE